MRPHGLRTMKDKAQLSRFHIFAERVRQRRLSFWLWALSLLNLNFALFTCLLPFGYRSSNLLVDFALGFFAVKTGSFGPEYNQGWMTLIRFLKFDEICELFFTQPLKISDGLYLIPLGWPSVIAVLFSSIVFWRPMKKLGPDDCHNCGYNLTGLTSDRCPECGFETSTR